MQVELLSITPDAEKLIEQAGRVCWKSEDKITEDSHVKFIQNLIKNGHTSVLEHSSATFKISGISRACSHQLVRSRLASFSQKSQRYIKENQFEYVIPESIKSYTGTDNDALDSYHYIMQETQLIYNNLVGIGIPKEDARYVIPNACCTEIVMTMNFREFRHFLKTRLNKQAQWEIRELAEEILVILKDNCPNVFEDINLI